MYVENQVESPLNMTGRSAKADPSDVVFQSGENPAAEQSGYRGGIQFPLVGLAPSGGNHGPTLLKGETVDRVASKMISGSPTHTASNGISTSNPTLNSIPQFIFQNSNLGFMPAQSSIDQDVNEDEGIYPSVLQDGCRSHTGDWTYVRTHSQHNWLIKYSMVTRL